MQRSIEGEAAWVTGAGSGVGRAAALMLAKAGCKLALSGRRREPLEETAAMIREAGGVAFVAPADMARQAEVAAAAASVEREFGRCDILLNNAGLNVTNRTWRDLDPAGVEAVIAADLAGPFYAAHSVLPMMRRRGSGLMIHVASWAGRHVASYPGAAYTAAKHGLVAMSATINADECVNGVRSCCICPGEIATPILKLRPTPASAEEEARMLQPDDMAETILFVARLPAHVCVNEILISPAWNRQYVRDAPGR